MAPLHRLPALVPLCLALSAGLLSTLESSVGWARASVETAAKGEANAAESATITFTGFSVFANGTSRIYVRLSSSVEVEQKVVKTTAEYVLHGARIATRNNENPLLTGHFSAAVVSARLVPVRAAKRGRHEHGPSDVRLIVQMREALAPEHRLVKNPDGTATLYVDFPKPRNPPPPEPDPVAPTPKASE